MLRFSFELIIVANVVLNVYSSKWTESIETISFTTFLSSVIVVLLLNRSFLVAKLFSDYVAG